MNSQATVDQIIALARRLTPLEKLKIIGHLAPDLEEALGKIGPGSPPLRRSLYGRFRGLGISEQDIAQARREMWGNFPREDI